MLQTSWAPFFWCWICHTEIPSGEIAAAKIATPRNYVCSECLGDVVCQDTLEALRGRGQ